MDNYKNPRLVLPDPLWIVADDTLAELEWQMRSSPLQHLAIGLGLVEELRAAKGKLSNWQLGQLLHMDLENFNFQPISFTYSSLFRSNYAEYARANPDKVARLTG